MQKQTIENDHLKIEVQREGAELCRIYSKSNNIEYMWNGNPDVWGSFSPVLFPIVGRLKDFKCRIEGQEYEMPQHGIVRRNPDCYFITTKEDCITVALDSSKETKKMYPYDFHFEITYQLIDSKIRVEYLVENKGNEEMYFSLGGHPAFRCPLFENENLEDYFIEFDQEENLDRWKVTEGGTIAKESVPFLKGKTIGLSKDLFNQDALVFKHQQSNRISLKSRLHEHGVSLQMANFPYLGIWSKPNANFICIEPWLGIADSEDFMKDFNQKEGIQCLGIGEQFSLFYDIIIY